MTMLRQCSKGGTATRLLVLLVLAILVLSTAGQKSDGIIRESLERTKKNPVTQLSIRQTPLKRKEQRRLAKMIRSIKNEDIQVVIGDSVQSDYSPNEMATKLVNTWQANGSMTERGILILMAMEQNRIEIEFGQGLAHILDADWCHEVALTKMVPWFREGDYARGIEEAILELENTLRVSKGGRKRKRRGQWLATMIGSYTAWRQRHNLRRGLQRLIHGRDHNHGSQPPPSSPPPPPFIGPLRRRRARRRRRYKAPKFSPPHSENVLSWFDLADIFSLFSRGSGTHGSPFAKTPTVSNVNVFVPPQRQQHPRMVVQERVTVAETVVQEPPVTTAKDNSRGNKASPKHPPLTSGEVSPTQSSTFRPVEALAKRQNNPKNAPKKDVSSPKSSSSGRGGGASWSTVDKRKSQDTTKSVSAARKPNTIKPQARYGGGASWSSPSSTRRSLSNEGTKKRNGGGASWSSTKSRSKRDDNSRGGGATW